MGSSASRSGPVALSADLPSGLVSGRGPQQACSKKGVRALGSKVLQCRVSDHAVISIDGPGVAIPTSVSLHCLGNSERSVLDSLCIGSPANARGKLSILAGAGRPPLQAQTAALDSV